MDRVEDEAGEPAYAEPCVIPTIAVSGVADRLISGGMVHVTLYVEKTIFDERGPVRHKEICLRFAMPIAAAEEATATASHQFSQHKTGEDLLPPTQLRC